MNYTPPSQVRDNAKRGLELRREHGRGGTEVGVARARDLSNGASLPLDTIKRMNSYFARHEVDKQGEGWGKDSAGYIAWLLWGGDAGWSWVKGILANKEKSNKMAELAYSYASILKSEKQADGTLKVYGKATDDSIDIDQQICDETWLKNAMPAWFESGGNVREQHSNIAAGVATDYESKADGHYITALVVDPVSVKKVEAGVLKGFSIGIRSPRIIRDSKAANGRIVDGQIVEVSLVDRPANPNAKLMLAKSVDGGNLEMVKQVSVPTPAELASVIKPLGNQNTKVETMTNKSDNPLEDIVEAVENIAHEVAEVVETVAHEVAEVVEQIAENVEAVAHEVEQVAETIADETKSVTGDVLKFDQNLYDAALKAITGLIGVEAEEAAAGSDEADSIHHLLKAIEHLKTWYEGEVAEGEVVGESNDDYIEMAADMCDKCDMNKSECKCAYKSATPELAVSDTVAGDIIEKAVQSAKKAVEAELESLKSVAATAESKVVALEAQLTDALSKTAAGGPVRSGIKNKSVNVDDLLVRAAEYRNKASVATDRTLAEGYRELADDLEKKARKGRK